MNKYLTAFGLLFVIFLASLTGSDVSAQQLPLINCAPSTPCDTVAGPFNTGTGDNNPISFGKTNQAINALNFTQRPPPQAEAQGFNTITYGPQVNITSSCNPNQNCWYLFNFLTVTPIPGQAVQNADGTVSLGHDGSGFGANISTAHLVGGQFKGKAFGGGYYIEWVFKFTPTLGSSALPFPAAWSLDSYFLTHGGIAMQWPGMPTGFATRIEQDYFQWPHNSLQYWEGGGTINWFGYRNNGNNLSGVQVTGTNGQISFTPNSPTHVGDFIYVTGTLTGTATIGGYVTTGTPYQVLSTDGSTIATLGTVSGAAITTTAGTTNGLEWQYANITQPNPQIGGEIKMGPNLSAPLLFSNYQRYGFLVKPATSTTQGTVLNYLNDVQMNYAAGAPNVVWNQYNSALLAPPLPGTSAGSFIDALQMVFIIDTDTTCPLTLQSVTIWQASDANNTISSLMTIHSSAANDDEYDIELAA